MVFQERAEPKISLAYGDPQRHGHTNRFLRYEFLTASLSLLFFPLISLLSCFHICTSEHDPSRWWVDPPPSHSKNLARVATKKKEKKSVGTPLNVIQFISLFTYLVKSSILLFLDCKYSMSMFVSLFIKYLYKNVT